MQQRSTIIAIALAAAMLATPVAVQAVEVYVQVGPPAPRAEAVPPPRRGFVWAPGHWGWAGGKWVWGAGRWMPERAGYRWEPDNWVHEGARWHYVPGHWAR